MKEKKALIAGANGLVGNELLQILLQEKRYEKVYAIVRRPLRVKHSKLIEVVCDFDRLEEVKEYFVVDDVFCCLGTTIKKAKTREAMFRVDVEYPVALAKLAKEQGAYRFLVVSAVNADVGSSIWYRRMKGALEEEIKNIPFPALSILRPSLLLGARKEFRFWESMAIGVAQGLSHLLKNLFPVQVAIQARTVAQAMSQIAQMNQQGVMIYSPTQMKDIEKASTK